MIVPQTLVKWQATNNLDVAKCSQLTIKRYRVVFSNRSFNRELYSQVLAAVDFC